MITGESHYLWGIRYRLKVIEHPAEIDGDRLLLYAPHDTPAEQRRTPLDHWYRHQLRQAIPEIIAKWSPNSTSRSQSGASAA